MDSISSLSESLTISVIVILVCVIYYKLQPSRHIKYPPGPSFALPLIGHLHLLGTKPHLTFRRWRKKYGPVFSLKLGGDNAVVISDAKLLKQVFSNPASNGRIRNPVMDVFAEGKYGLVNQADENWAHQRRFTVRTLSTLGLAKGGVLEGILADEAKYLIKSFKKRVNRPFPGNSAFNGAVLNSIWTVLTGERNEWDAPEVPVYIKKTDEFLKAGNRLMETGLVFFPGLRFVAPKMSGWTGWVENNRVMDELADEIIEKHTKRRGLSNDFIDHYLMQIDATTDPSSGFYGSTGGRNLQGIILDVIIAGSETMATTMEYIVLYLSKYKHVQKEMQCELDREIGKQFPSLSDRQKLPYTVAFILETMRRSSILVMGVPHSALENIELDDYFIPKNTIIIGDAYNIHHSQETWGSDSYDFRPERFLNEERTKVVYREGLIPYSTGRRICIGESLANDTLFLFVASLLQSFDVDITNDMFDLNDVIPGFLIKPKPFEIIVKVRNL